MKESDVLSRFATGPTIRDRWVAARELMSARQLTVAADSDNFKAGYKAAGEEANTGSRVDRLIAVDVIVRLSNFVKKLRPLADDFLGIALRHELPSLSLLNSETVPHTAKPAEFRENVAVALKRASGDWVIPYITRALVEEEKSQRCRLELARQLVEREPSIDRCLSNFISSPLSTGPEVNLEHGAARLRDIAAALADAIRQKRSLLTASESAGGQLSHLCRIMVPITSRSTLPKRLGTAAAEVVRVLDEIFSVRLTLIAEPDAYSVLETFERWWQPLPYPKMLRDSLVPVCDKLVTGITLRARAGQISEGLAVRLRQLFGNRDLASQQMRQIAQDETGLEVEIDDWLRGRSRTAVGLASAVSNSLQAVSDENLSEALASLLLDAEEVKTEVQAHIDLHHLRRLVSTAKSLASQRGLQVVGSVGDMVEYRPLAHQTVSGKMPTNPRVVVLRPMVVRQRHDGSEDVILRAIVEDTQAGVS